MMYLFLILVYLCVFCYSLPAELLGEESSTSESGCGCSGSGLSRDTSTLTLKDATSSKRNLLEDKLYEINSKMTLIDGGKSFMGTNKPQMKDGESPLRPVVVSSFYIDTYEVSNDDYAAFVDDTSFVTESELFGWSFVFEHAIPAEIKKNITQSVLGAEWWLPVNGSYWKEPEGPGTDVFTSNRGNYPVVHVSWNDAVQYCKWRGARLPTEAEWEYAAKGPEALSSTESPSLFPWGDELTPNKQHRCNIYQGKFPVRNTVKDGYEFIAPVDAFPPQNSYGLYNMIGNVWEWVEDWFTIHHNVKEQVNPKGPTSGVEKVKKGGSFLCHKSFCYRYRSVARFPSTPDSATYNVGFRCAMDMDQHIAAMESNDEDDVDEEEDVDEVEAVKEEL